MVTTIAILSLIGMILSTICITAVIAILGVADNNQ